MSTSTPADNSARDQLLRQFKSNLANAGSTPTAAASAGETLAAQGFALQATEGAGVEALERVGAEGGDQPRQQQTEYLVVVGNVTRSTVFSQLGVVFARTGSQEPEIVQATNVGPGQGVEFHLGSCSALQGYIVALSVGANDPVQIIPAPPEVMTPQLASQINPADPGPCVDQWPIGDA